MSTCSDAGDALAARASCSVLHKEGLLSPETSQACLLLHLAVIVQMLLQVFCTMRCVLSCAACLRLDIAVAVLVQALLQAFEHHAVGAAIVQVWRGEVRRALPMLHTLCCTQAPLSKQN